MRAIKIIFVILIVLTVSELIYYIYISLNSGKSQTIDVLKQKSLGIPPKYEKSDVMKQQIDNLYYYLGDETVASVTTIIDYNAKVTKILTEEDFKKNPESRDPEGNFPGLMLELTSKDKATNTYYSKRNVEDMKIYDVNNKLISPDSIKNLMDKTVSIKKSYQLKNVANISDPDIILFAIEIHVLE